MDIETNICYIGDLNSGLDSKLDNLAKKQGLSRISSGYGYDMRDLQYSTENYDIGDQSSHEKFINSLKKDNLIKSLSDISTTTTYLRSEIDEDNI